MKNRILILIIILSFAFIALPVSSNEEINATYGETYMCGDAYTARIVTQPQMMAEIAEKIPYYVERRNPQTGRYEAYQIQVKYAQRTEEDILLLFRLQLRNLNELLIKGLSPDSFVLTGKVRDRVIEYKPEIMMPFIMEEEDWEISMIRAQVMAYKFTNRVPPYTITFDISDYWNPLLLNEKNIDSMRLQEIRLIYRVPSWLVGWDLHIHPKPMAEDSNLKTCDLVLHLPTVMNEITRETYKYIY